MARVSYLTRREGRYYLQVRCSHVLAAALDRSLFRTSLRTADYRQARRRVAECMGWIYGMNDSIDYSALFEKNVRQLRTYLAERVPLDEDRLFARRSYEEMLKNFNRRAQANGVEPSVIDPHYRALFDAFVAQNVEAEAQLRHREKQFAYERGRADVTMGIEFGIIPVPHVAAPATDIITPVRQAPASIELAIDDAPLTPRQSDASKLPRTKTPLSEALETYLAKRHEQLGHDGDRGDLGLVVQFMIDQLGDPQTGAMTVEQLQRIERMLPDIPDRVGMPREFQVSLTSRYNYAQKHGWKGLKRLTETRLRKGYHAWLDKFFRWLIREGYYAGPQPKFAYLSSENLLPLPRDSFDQHEVLKIFGMPLFTGCLSHTRIWQPGQYFIQNNLYWAYILALMTGMRPGEIGQLRVSDLERRGDHVLINLQLFDPTKGRVARKDVRQLKTENAERKIPLHPLIVDLGLLERANSLKEIGCEVLFPEWDPYRKPSGEMRWGQPISKSWQYLKKQLSLSRANISLYSARHWMADQLDDLVISQRTRQRVLGHSANDDAPAGYGAKGKYSSRDLEELTGIGADVLADLSAILLGAKQRADAGGLTVLRPWLQRARWSPYHRERMKASSEQE
jgi:integrase